MIENEIDLISDVKLFIILLLSLVDLKNNFWLFDWKDRLSNQLEI